MVDWNVRFQQQADWTRSLREFIYPQIGVQSASRLLEIGCGTGVICRELKNYCSAAVLGADINLSRISIARQNDPDGIYLGGDAFHLPFSDNSFDVTLSHYLLLWLNAPANALQEMVRVTRPGGFIAALAEPDYGARVDSPHGFANLGDQQTRSLVRQGANPLIGRELPGLFSSLELEQIQYGSSGFQTLIGELPQGWENEWQVIASDLKDVISLSDLEEIKAKDREAWLAGERVLWVPTFYIFGKKV